VDRFCEVIDKSWGWIMRFVAAHLLGMYWEENKPGDVYLNIKRYRKCSCSV